MKLFKRVNHLIGSLGIPVRDERPLDFHLTQEDIEAELHYPRHDLSASAESLRVTFVQDAQKP